MWIAPDEVQGNAHCQARNHEMVECQFNILRTRYIQALRACPDYAMVSQKNIRSRGRATHAPLVCSTPQLILIPNRGQLDGIYQRPLTPPCERLARDLADLDHQFPIALCCYPTRPDPRRFVKAVPQDVEPCHSGLTH